MSEPASDQEKKQPKVQASGECCSRVRMYSHQLRLSLNMQRRRLLSITACARATFSADAPRSAELIYLRAPEQHSQQTVRPVLTGPAP